ncbi:hypothetical protein SAMN05444411_1422 [Lutibacter oricola]|uniref:Uncharacterized protein n=1 Tax=Lutibacter oricola TaxID=762486 RepID=A0A1H3HJM9_9FLAO|nr:hypothetical protein [Lutibacter oricola]SDY15425.1 hypothetical protein SAMN05444411_1422 [Lutibacter oricola]
MYTKRLINKKIEHLSTNEIFEIIDSSNDFDKIKSVKSELKQRSLNNEEMIIAKKEYENYKTLKKNRKNEILTISEWLSFFFIIFKMGRYFSPSESFTDSELERFILYGYETKYKQAIYAKRLGIIFFFLIIPLWIFIIGKWI